MAPRYDPRPERPSLSELIPQLTADEIRHVSAYGERRRFGRGEMIFQRGDRGDTMFVIVDGEVELIFSEGVPNKWLEDGDYFGELALIAGEHLRTATAVSRVETEALCLGQPSFDRLQAEEPAFLAALVRRSCSYLLASEQRLIKVLERQNRELVQTLDYLRRTREELDRQELLSRTDELTGLYNRRCYDDQLPRFVARARETGSSFALLALDLDGFKEANDTHGHAFGDVVLTRIGSILRDEVRTRDLPCRVGGDEFAILLFDATAEVARDVAERIRKRIEAEHFEPGGADGSVPITVSLGLALLAPEEAVDALRTRADDALYRAKREGRNRLSI